MGPVHPQVTHFPIALIITAFLLQIVVVLKPAWLSRSTSLWLLGLAVVLSIVSALSGQDAANRAVNLMELSESTRSLLTTHRRFANLTLWTSLGTFLLWLWLFLRSPSDRRVDRLALALLFILSLSVAATGYLGGELVLSHGVGVSP
ncbi:MAG: DUF2231 domain-containing protein [Fidelibacterota bacterium]